MHAFTHLDQTRHGTPSFPAEYYYVDSHHPRYSMPFHWHSEWELLRILTGEFVIYLDEEEYHAREGDIFLIGGGMLHGGIPHECTYECFVFDLYGLFRSMDIVKAYLRPFYRQTEIPSCYFPNGENPAVALITEELMSTFRFSRENAAPELDTVGCLCRLFSLIRRESLCVPNSETAGNEMYRIDQIKSVLEYIESNFGSPLSLEELSGVIGQNPKYFCRTFRRLTHQSPMDYVNFYRVEQAAYLLSTTKLSVTSIALECGFCESSYFTKVFKKYKGTTPKKYREAAVG